MQLIKQGITEVVTTNYMPYTAYVIMERALPEIDGFKPSQRRILYTMFKMGLLKGVRRKSQGVVGSTMFLHPHGDGAIYEALVRMSKDSESLLIPFIDSKGNFGKQYSRDMQYASARYTEVRLEKIAQELFKDIDKDTVEMIDNFDGTMKEPRLLPVTFPTILTNTQIGIANGMASSIPSFNLVEVIDYVIAYIKNPKSQVKDYIKAPDFPTGGNIIYNESVFNNIFDNGRGTFKIRATYEFVDDTTILFEEIPYTATYEPIIEKIKELVKDGKIKEIVKVDNVYGLKTKGIEVKVKKGTDKEKIVQKLYKLTPLESSFGCNFNIVVNGRPQVLGIKQIIHQWLQFRVQCIVNGAKSDKEKKEYKKRMLLALKQVLLDIDKAITIIRGTKNNKETISSLMDAFNIDEEQAEYVADIKLRYLNKDYLINRIEEIKVVEEEIEKLNDLMTNKMTIAKLIISQLKDIKKNYGEERKSKIISSDDIVEVEKETIEIEDYNVKVFVTKDGYVKKIPLTSLRGNFDIRVKDGDEIIGEYDTTNNSDILIFTDKYNVYKYKSYQLDDSKPSLLGDYMPSVLGLKDESIQYITVTNDYKGFLLIGFEDGKVAKIDLSAYETKQNRSMLKNAYANKKALYFNHIFDDVDILAISSIGKALVFNTSMINPKTSKTTIGIQILKSKNDSVATLYTTIEEEYEETDYYRIQNSGVGKYLRKGDFQTILDKQE